MLYGHVFYSRLVFVCNVLKKLATRKNNWLKWWMIRSQIPYSIYVREVKKTNKRSQRPSTLAGENIEEMVNLIVINDPNFSLANGATNRSK